MSERVRVREIGNDEGQPAAEDRAAILGVGGDVAGGRRSFCCPPEP